MVDTAREKDVAQHALNISNGMGFTVHAVTIKQD